MSSNGDGSLKIPATLDMQKGDFLDHIEVKSSGQGLLITRIDDQINNRFAIIIKLPFKEDDT
jgi:hypothetical protein